MWQFGRLLIGFVLLQLISGIFLIINYINYERSVFFRCLDLWRDFNFRWIIHNLHANGARFIFISLYLHIARGIYYKRFLYNKYAWLRGVRLFIIIIIIAFFGYVLPWGQISYWGVTVITRLLTVVPYIGGNILEFIWGDLLIGQYTLTRFTTLHFLLPFLLLLLIIVHIGILHKTLSSRPVNTNNIYYIKFYYLFIIKDIFFTMLIFLLFIIVCIIAPNIFGDSENYNESNILKTPLHIQPEWYFLFAYSILRRVPNKTGGVLLLLISVVLLYFFPLKNYSTNKISRYIIYIRFIILTFTGAIPVGDPFLIIRQIFGVLYFIGILI